MSSSTPATVKDFTVLSIFYRATSFTKTVEHFLYLKEHISRPHTLKPNQTREIYPNGRTLFIVNTPPDSTEREFRLFFQSCGHVERVVLQGYEGNELIALTSEDEEIEEGDESGSESRPGNVILPSTKKRRKKEKTAPEVKPLPSDTSEIPLRVYRPTGSTAYIIFAEPGAIANALQLRTVADDRRLWPPGGGEFALAPTGLAHYEALHTAERPSLDAVKKHADSYLEVYDYNQAKLRRANRSKYKKGEGIVDEDGFTLVVRGGAYGQSVGGGVGVASKTFMREMEKGETASISTSKRKKKKKKHEKEDFYKFQIHEKRRQELIELKTKFEKDKEKIAAKRSRYQPY